MDELKVKIKPPRFFNLEAGAPLLRLMQDAEEQGQTILHCTYYGKPIYENGGWVNIWPTTYLIEEDLNNRLQLLHALEVPMAPDRHYFQKAGERKTFTLIFPAVPKHWTHFSLLEMAGSSAGFYINSIARSESGVYWIYLQ